MPFSDDKVTGLVVVCPPINEWDEPVFAPVPLTKVDVDIRVVNFIAQVGFGFIKRLQLAYLVKCHL